MKKITKRLLVSSALFVTFPFNVTTYALTKNETVYTKLNTDGTVKNIIVNEELKNIEKGKVKDLTTLQDIINVNGDEKFSLSNNEITFDSVGNDIFYQGKINKELPIKTTIKYYLNDEEKSVDKILGKKGTIRIEIEYENTDSHTVKINGQNKKMYTPFVVTTGMIIENKNNKNIEVNNGKVVSTGTNSIVALIATPGLSESLDVSDLDNLNKMTIKFETTKFELPSIYSVYTPKVFDNVDLEVFDRLDNLKDSIDKLESASSMLVDGATKVNDGAKQIDNGSKALKEGTSKLSNGSKEISNAVSSSTKKLQNDNSDALDKETIDKIAETAQNNTNLSDEVLKEISNIAKESAKASIMSKLDNIGAQAGNSATLSEEDKNKIIYQSSLSIDENSESIKYSADLQIDEMIESLSYYGIDITEEIVSALKLKAEDNAINYAKQIAATSAIKTAESVIKETAKNTAKETALIIAEEVSSEVSKQTAITISKSVSKEVASSLAPQIANQVKASAKNQTIASLNELSIGLNQLSNGILELENGATTLNEGTKELQQGTESLQDGMNEFNNDGIKKLTNALNKNVFSKTESMKKLIELSREYDTFTLKNKEDTSQTKFISIIDSMKK